MISENSIKLKIKIEQFSSKFLSKDQIFVFEQNKFDIILDSIFNVLKIFLLPISKFFLGSMMESLECRSIKVFLLYLLIL